MNPDLRRAFEFIARGDMGGTRHESTRFGVAVFDEDCPLRYDANYLLADERAERASPEELNADARGLDRTAIMFRDAQLGERFAPFLVDRGWIVHRGVVMAHRRAPSRPVDRHAVEEVDEAALRPARRAHVAGEPWATPEVVQQLLDAKLAIARRVDLRAFAVLVDGEVVSYTDLYSDGATAQIEDLATLPEHRGRGYASALVVRAVEEARVSGCALVFLVTDAEDWPQHLYRKLGFDELGRYVKFFRPTAAPSSLAS